MRNVQQGFDISATSRCDKWARWRSHHCLPWLWQEVLFTHSKS